DRADVATERDGPVDGGYRDVPCADLRVALQRPLHGVPKELVADDRLHDTASFGSSGWRGAPRRLCRWRPIARASLYGTAAIAHATAASTASRTTTSAITARYGIVRRMAVP